MTAFMSSSRRVIQVLLSTPGACVVGAVLALALLASYVNVLLAAVARGPLIAPQVVARAPKPQSACNLVAKRDCGDAQLSHASAAGAAVATLQ